MKIFKPSIAKILSVPALWWVCTYVQAVFTELFFPNSSDGPPGVWFNLFFLLAAYILSCLIWEFGKNHRRILIGVFTVLSSFTGFAYWNFGLPLVCGTSTQSPCDNISGPCPEQPGCPHQLIGYGYIITVIILIIGLALFIREEKKNKKNGKKKN
jgi:hypothetical protein